MLEDYSLNLNRALLALVLGGCGLASQANADQPGSIELRGIFGDWRQVSDLVDSPTQAIVFIVMDDHCPVVRQYTERLIALHERYNGFERDRAGVPIRRLSNGSVRRFRYPGDEVVFVGVYVSPGLSIKRMAEHAANALIPFRVMLDADQEFVKHFGLRRLSEALVLDRDLEVQYRGAIDDQFFQGGSKPAPTRHYLRDAVDAVIKGGAPPAFQHASRRLPDHSARRTRRIDLVHLPRTYQAAVPGQVRTLPPRRRSRPDAADDLQRSERVRRNDPRGRHRRTHAALASRHPARLASPIRRRRSTQ